MYKTIEYFKRISALIKKIEDEEMEKIELSINLIVEAIKNKNNLFVFGASHASIISQELFYRAGGLVNINPIFEPSIMLDMRPVTFTSEMERLKDYGTKIARKTYIREKDIVICHSVSGRNDVMIDFTIEAKKRGAKIIGITNMKYSKSVKSRHISGKKLYELSDIVIDNNGEIGDACISFENLAQKVGPTSTISGALIVNSIVCGVVERLLDKEIEPPIFYSANIDGGDEKNKKILEKYKENIFFM